MAGTQGEGLLIIPDISGFTEFVNEVEITHSQHIVSELLELIVQGNRLNLKLSAVEGDAVFFYRLGPLPTVRQLCDQAELWLRAFHSHLALMRRDLFCRCGACQSLGNLGLKVVAHGGTFAVQEMSGKSNVFGMDVILVHRLLKSDVPTREYLLLSESLVNGCEASAEEREPLRSLSQEYPVIGEVPLAWLDYAWVSGDVPPPPERATLDALDGQFKIEIEIDAPFELTAAKLADLEFRPRWIEGMSRIEFDRSVPMRSGHHHICVWPKQAFEITLDRVLQSEDTFAMAAEFKPPPMLARLRALDEVLREGTLTRVRQTFYYKRRPVVGWMFDLMGVSQLKGLCATNLSNLKRLLEAGDTANP